MNKAEQLKELEADVIILLQTLTKSIYGKLIDTGLEGFKLVQDGFGGDYYLSQDSIDVRVPSTKDGSINLYHDDIDLGYIVDEDLSNLIAVLFDEKQHDETIKSLRDKKVSITDALNEFNGVD